MADSVDHEALVSEFCDISGASPGQAMQYLQANNWDLASATTSYFQDEEEGGDASAPSATDAYTGPRTLDGRPAPDNNRPAAASSSSKQKKKGIATLGSMGGSSHAQSTHDDDDESDSDYEDEGRGNLFAGGEKSGLAVQDPHQDSRPKKVIDDILAKARANTARPDADADGEPQPDRFRGTGMTLGGDGVESRSVPDPLAHLPSHGEPQERILHLWQDGFSIDDGELRRFDDPANQEDLRMIRSGRAPLHLMNVQHDQAVDLKVHQHDGPFTPPPKKYKPFSGAGNRLGSHVPGSPAASTPQASTPTNAPAATATPSVDESQPAVTIRIQLPDGTRLPARFNTSSTVGDIYAFIRNASSETRDRAWVLATTFPNKQHTDESLIIGEMAEFKKGGTAVVKWT